MRILLRYIFADFKKTKNLSFRFLHLIIPICLSLIFIMYYSYSPWDSRLKVEAYFQVLAIGLPILISLFSSILIEQEFLAGEFQGILMLEKKGRAFFSKFILLLSFTTFFLILACGIFGAGYFYFLKQDFISYSFYLLEAFVLLGSNIFLCIWHMFLALRFNKGISIGVGIIESLIAALMITGLGESIWIYIPCAWGARFVSLLLKAESTLLNPIMISEVNTATIICIILTVVSIFIFGVWFINWEGKRSRD